MNAPGSAKLVANSLSARIRDEIIAMIASRKLSGGERLNEVRLAEHFGVSRGPVREAARELEGLGYIISKPRFGFFVVEFRSEEILDLYEVKEWTEHALTVDYLRHAPREALIVQKALLAGIDRSSAVAFSAGVLEFRVKALQLVHNRFLAQQALFMYRRVAVMSTLVLAENVSARMERLIGWLDGYWQALIDGDRKAADRLTTEANTFWQRDVAPRFGAGAGKERKD